MIPLISYGQLKLFLMTTQDSSNKVEFFIWGGGGGGALKVTKF